MLINQSEKIQMDAKLFISHSSKDIEIINPLVNLLKMIGIKENQLFCSSETEYGIPLGENVYNWLKKELNNPNLFVVMVMSNDYYGSVPCMVEMGATWVKDIKHQTILSPGFSCKKVEGPLDPDLHFMLDKSNRNRKKMLDKFLGKVCSHLGIKSKEGYPLEAWENFTSEFWRRIDLATVRSGGDMYDYEGRWLELHPYNKTVAVCHLNYCANEYIFKGKHYGNDNLKDISFASRIVWNTKRGGKGFEYITKQGDKKGTDFPAYGYVDILKEDGIISGEGMYADAKKCGLFGRKKLIEHHVWMVKCNKELYSFLNVKDVISDSDLARETIEKWLEIKKRIR